MRWITFSHFFSFLEVFGHVWWRWWSCQTAGEARELFSSFGLLASSFSLLLMKEFQILWLHKVVFLVHFVPPESKARVDSWRRLLYFSSNHHHISLSGGFWTINCVILIHLSMIYLIRHFFFFTFLLLLFVVCTPYDLSDVLRNSVLPQVPSNISQIASFFPCRLGF